MSDNRIEDHSKDHAYFIITPQLVWALCKDPYEFTLWSVIKMVAGDAGECYLSSNQLASLSMMSLGKVSQCRKRLIDIGLLEGEIRRDPGYPQPVWHLRVPDLWQLNIKWRQRYNLLTDRLKFKEYQKELSPDESLKSIEDKRKKLSPDESFKELSPGEKGPSPDERKKIQKEEHVEEEHIWSTCLKELQFQMPRAAFDQWLRGSELLTLKDDTATIQVRDQYAAEWCSNRLLVPIQRTLAGILGRDDLQVEFVTREDVDKS